MVEGVDTPERGRSMVGQVGRPVHGVDADQDGGDDHHPWPQRQPAEHEESGVVRELDPEAGLHQGEHRNHRHREQHQVAGVDQVSGRQHGPAHGRPQPLGHY